WRSRSWAIRRRLVKPHCPLTLAARSARSRRILFTNRCKELKDGHMQQISASELGKHRLFVATPAFGGNCQAIYAHGLADLAIASGIYRFPLDTCFYTNESLVTRARNYCVDSFLSVEDATHLLFIDADIGFKGSDALELFVLSILDPKYEIIGGTYRIKDIEKKMYAFNWEAPGDLKSDEPIEVSGIGTGFMLIRRGVFAKL